MTLPRFLQREQFPVWISVTLFGALFGYVYTSLTYLQQPDSVGSPWLGIATGLMIGGFTAAFEISFVNAPNSYFRRLAFLPALLWRSLVHLFLIFFSLTFCQYVYFWITGYDVTLFTNDWKSTLVDIAVSFAVLTAIVTFFQFRMFIGGRQLTNLILGKYHKAIAEERVFVFVDIVGSTVAAQTLGDVQFHKYLNRLFMLLDEPITRFGGEVHSYVGDAIIAVWPFYSDPQKNRRVLSAVSSMQEICSKHSTAIEQEFGIKPQVRIALHAGPVIVGETGSSKRQITYLGNTVNVTARIEAKSKELEKSVLSSDEFLSRCALPDHTAVKPLGEHRFKGVNAPIALSSLEFQS